MLKFHEEEVPVLVMASSSHRPCLTSDNNNPHFFKVVLARTLKEQKLEIPKKFVRQHGVKAFLNNQACLKVPDGTEWNVGLRKSNGRVWFHEGWQKFVEFYSVGLEYFLVFRFERQSSSFHVVIFDLSATEVEYPVREIRLHEADEMVKMETDFEVGGDRAFGGIKPMKPPAPAPSTARQRARAMAKAATFQSKTLNSSFMCKISPSHIQPGKSLNIPKSFAEMHLEEPTEIILEISDGRIWSVSCGFYWIRRKQRKTANLRNGWKRFARENYLQVGDVCVFEMITKTSRRISLKVDIFRASSSSI